MISGGNATVYVSNLDAAVEFYTSALGLKLTNRFGNHWATIDAGPSYWTSAEEVGAGLTIGLHPPSPTHPGPGTIGAVGYGFETYETIEDVAARLAERGVRIDGDIVAFEAGKVVSLVDQDGTPTYVWEFTPEMKAEGDDGEDEDGIVSSPAAAHMVSGGHAIVYVSNMDRAIRFYTETLGMKLTYRYGDHFATAEAGKLLLAIHPQTPRTPIPGTKGSVMLGLSVDEPIDRVVSRLAARGVRVGGAPGLPERLDAVPPVRTETDSFVELEDPDGNAIYLWEEHRREDAATKTSQDLVPAE
jgi:catechol 2,3-dioxygenase